MSRLNFRPNINIHIHSGNVIQYEKYCIQSSIMILFANIATSSNVDCCKYINCDIMAKTR